METDNGTLAVLSIILILIILALISKPTSQNNPAKIDKEVLYLDCDTIHIDKQKRNISGTIVKSVML